MPATASSPRAGVSTKENSSDAPTKPRMNLGKRVHISAAAGRVEPPAVSMRVTQ